MHVSCRKGGYAVAALWLALLPVGGCATRTYLIATPTVCASPDARARYEALPESLHHTAMQILYAVDRAAEEPTDVGLRYSATRSGYLAFGLATVEIEPALTWEQLVSESTGGRRAATRQLRVTSAVECGLLAMPLTRMEVRDGRYRLHSSALKELEQSQEALRKTLRERMQASSSRDVYIFVHGFNNSFDDALFRIAQIWHFMGRRGVPIAYSWPAGRGGLFGYAYDRESGEFTVYHLKRFISAVAACPEVERIHLIAHSRGTDVAVSALRELNIHFKARGLPTREQLKLEDLVLAAPDLDADVFEQRYAIEDLHSAVGRTTVYLSKGDLALSLSNWLFGGSARLGTLTLGQLSPEAQRKLSQLSGFSLIECDVSGYSTSHDYAFAHPAVVSDMILLLRDNRAPGAANGRPLERPSEGVWRITNAYLRPEAATTSPRLARSHQ